MMRRFDNFITDLSLNKLSPTITHKKDILFRHGRFASIFIGVEEYKPIKNYMQIIKHLIITGKSKRFLIEGRYEKSIEIAKALVENIEKELSPINKRLTEDKTNFRGEKDVPSIWYSFEVN